MKRITLAAFIGIIAFATLAMGCLDRQPGPVCPVPTEIATTRQTANDFDGVDLLVVVDNSGSMSEEQEILSTGFFTLINSLGFPLENDPTWTFPAVDNIRVAIVTSDMGIQWGDGQTGGNEITVDHCDKNGPGDNGAFQSIPMDVTFIDVGDGIIKCDPDGVQCPAGFNCVNGFCASASPGVQTVNCDPMAPGALWAETKSIDLNTSLSTQVACMAKQGDQGCGVEQQLEAAVKGLKTNPDFMVATHLLAVLVVSDEEDCSIQSNGLFQTEEWLSGNRPTGYLNVACNWPEANEQFLFPPEEYYTRFVGLKKDQATAVIFAAIVGVPPKVGDTPSRCQGNGTFIQENGCLDDPAMQIEIREFQQEQPDGTISTYNHFRPACTRDDDVTQEEVTSARPGRRYVKVAQEFKTNGYVYSICNKDWSEAMKSIAEIIARQITATCYPKQLDWSMNSGPNPDRLGKAKCDVVMEVLKTGTELSDETCPAELYKGLTPAEQKEYQSKRQVIVEKKGGVVKKKTIMCPLPKIATPKDCTEAQAYVRDKLAEDYVGWYYCEKTGENFDDACDDNGIDNDGNGKADCADEQCQDCTVCGGTGVDCEDGCRYGVEVTEEAKRIATGHYLSVQCLQRFKFEDQNCQEDTHEACNDRFDNDGNGIWNCNDTLNNVDDKNPHLPDPNCCGPLTKGPDGICNPNPNQIQAIKQICPNDDDGNANGWSWTNVGACVARARELGCNFPGTAVLPGDTDVN